MASLNPSSLPVSWAATPEARERQRAQLAQAQLDDNTISDLFDDIASEGKAEVGHTRGKSPGRKTPGAGQDAAGLGAAARKTADALQDATQTPNAKVGDVSVLAGPTQSENATAADGARAADVGPLEASGPALGDDAGDSPDQLGSVDATAASVVLAPRPNDILP